MLLLLLYYEIIRHPSEETTDDDEDSDDSDESDTFPWQPVPIHNYDFHAYMDSRIKNDWILMIESMDIAKGKTTVFYERGSIIKLE